MNSNVRRVLRKILGCDYEMSTREVWEELQANWPYDVTLDETEEILIRLWSEDKIIRTDNFKWAREGYIND
jgi:hypothetical protein